MFGRKLKAENAQLRAELRRAVDRAEVAEHDAAQARQVQRFQIEQRAKAEADNIRLTGRNRHLTRLLDSSELAKRHQTLLAACARYRQQLNELATPRPRLDDRGPLPEGGPIRRQSLVTRLSIAEETVRKLEERLRAREQQRWPRHTPPTQGRPVQPAVPGGQLPARKPGRDS